ncbi:copper amine oxidase N-terminal domain-containing protein [Paenibacillus daejeonensis]|uniref:copper amine oxidase N-terminal domain-containing protein n=1 Tax=Paenibacillus daejeonensis TaxID=135193 RepID=UPI0003716AAD|nr:copper amine oxidase N-terminal domain-containing protein [Paenibacillus daejeonensis]
MGLRGWKTKTAALALCLSMVMPLAASAYVPEDAALVGLADREVLYAGFIAQRVQDEGALNEQGVENGTRTDPSTEPGTEQGNELEPQPTMTITMALGSDIIDIDGETVTMAVAPLIKDGTTYIPLRYLAEAIGAEVGWDQQQRATTVTAGADVARFWTGRTFMELNSIQRHFATPVIVQDGRTLVPVRFIAELFGWDVMFSEIDNTIRLTR